MPIPITEEDAAKKWCPAVRFTPATAAQTTFSNRGDRVGGDQTASITCLGAACMWWDEEIETKPAEGGGQTRVATGRGTCGVVTNKMPTFVIPGGPAR